MESYELEIFLYSLNVLQSFPRLKSMAFYALCILRVSNSYVPENLAFMFSTLLFSTFHGLRKFLECIDFGKRL